MNNNNTLKYRVGQLEDKYKSLDNKIDDILTNHLPHIEQNILKLRTEVRLVGAILIGSGILLWAIQRALQ